MMPLDYDLLSTSQKRELIYSGHRFMQTLFNVVGSEVGFEVWNQLSSVVSPLYAQDMTMQLITGPVGDVIITSVGANVIDAIKVVRAYTNLGLKEAKDIIDSARYSQNGRVQVLDPHKRHLMVDELKAVGCTMLGE